jgi:hypothetical protein
VFGWQARSRYSDAKHVCGGAINPCARDQVANAQHRVDLARRSALYSNIAVGAAGAAAVAAVILWVSAPSLEVAPVAIAPSVTGGSLGLVVGGAF